MVSWEAGDLPWDFGVWVNADSSLLAGRLVFVRIWERRGLLFFVPGFRNGEAS